MSAHLQHRLDLRPVASRLLDHHRSFQHVPDLTLEQAGRFLDDCLAVLFPHFANDKRMSVAELEARLMTLAGRLRVILCEVTPENCPDADKATDAFIDALPNIATAIRGDAAAILENDPAAASINEVIIAYPGLRAIAAYRLARRLVELKVPEFPRLISEYAHVRTGIDINPGARIGRSFFLDHGTGVVIGGTAIIGDNVKIYQGVTLGALRVRAEERNAKRHPTVEDNVTIYANATILGGQTVVGRDSIIGGNVWLTRSVPPNSRVMYRSVGWQGLAEPEPERPDDYVI